jgi:hypothetical protein
MHFFNVHFHSRSNVPASRQRHVVFLRQSRFIHRLFLVCNIHAIAETAYAWD